MDGEIAQDLNTSSVSRRSLPVGWEWSSLGVACDLIMGQSPPSDTYNIEGVGLPFYQGKAEFGGMYPLPQKWCSKPGKVAEAGDVLVSVRAPVGPTNLCRDRSSIGRGLAAIRPREGMDSRYFLYALRRFEPELQKRATGTTFSAIGKQTLSDQAVPIAPAAEQRRIVAKIEELLSELDAGVVALKRAQANLTRYKASVLQAACEGRLVPQDPNDEPAAVLLERILAGRRAKWEADLLAQGKDPRKAKYVEPEPADTNGLPDLPVGWCWASAEQLSDATRSITYGVLKLGTPLEEGVPTLRSSDVRHLRIDLSHVKRISPDIARHYRRTLLQGGEVLVTVRGTLGGVAVAPHECAGYNVSREVAVIALVEPGMGAFVSYALGSPGTQRWLLQRTKGIAYTGINIGTLKQTPLPLPPQREQGRIVTQVERCLSEGETLEAVAARGTTGVRRLRQAILRRAFEGALLRQDPADEPATILLERIQAAREASELAGEGRRRAGVRKLSKRKLE